ncbi:MAG: TRAP transporter substrate-binding protein [Dehalococcoidia bacterium]|nr:TRAP transporter substrate-binding protein [Dehalococcoidia bacterium]
MTLLLVLVATSIGCAPTQDSGSSSEAQVQQQAGDSGMVTPEYDLSCAAHMTSSDPRYIPIEHFCNMIYGATDGRMNVKFYGAGMLGDQEETFDAVTTGDLAMGFSSPYSTYHEILNVKGLPFAGATPESADKLFYNGGVLDVILDHGWELTGCKSLATTENGWMAYATDAHPLVTPDDFSRLKVRVPTSDVYVKTFTKMCPDSLGEAIPWSEIYTSLERGVIDATCTYIGSYMSEKHYEVCHYYTDVNQMYNRDDIIMNLDLYDSLPGYLQETLKECAKTLEANCRFRYRAQASVIEEKLSAEGCEFTHLTPDQRKVFIDRVQPFEIYDELYSDLLEKYFPGQNMYERLVNEVKVAEGIS